LQAFEDLEGLHPAVASALNNLGAIHKAMGALEPAGQAYQEASDIYHLVYSAEHKSTLTAKHNLALLHKAKGDLDSAEALSRSVLLLRRGAEVPEPQAIAASLGVLGGVLHAQGNFQEAQDLLQEAMSIHTENETEHSTQAAAILNDFALLRRDQGQLANAMAIAETTVGLRLKLLGVKHPDFAVSVYNLKSIYEETGSEEKAAALGELLEKYEFVDVPKVENAPQQISTPTSARGAGGASTRAHRPGRTMGGQPAGQED